MTRNWTLTEDVPRAQINALWDALHNVPDLLTRWHADADDELFTYFDEYNEQFAEPGAKLRS
jgi:hypothetical protein